MVSFSAVLVLSTLLSQTAGETPDLRCGSYCLYISLKALDLPVKTFEDLEQKLGQPSAAGYSFGELEEVARSYGVQTLGVETNFDNLRRRPGRFACIARIGGNHFVNIVAVDEKRAQIIDPPKQYQLPLETLRTLWKGKALLLSNEPLLSEEDLPRPFPLKSVVIVIFILAGALSVVLVLRNRRLRFS